MNSNKKTIKNNTQIINTKSPKKDEKVIQQEFLEKKRTRLKEKKSKENQYKAKFINGLKVIEFKGIDYYPIIYERDSERNNRTTNYYCNKHEEIILLGQMEAVGRHFADEHPETLPKLKHVIGLRNFLLFRCRVFINTLLKFYKDKIDFNRRGNVKEILTQMVFDNKTIKFVDNWHKGFYSNKYYSCNSCVPKKILDNFLQLCETHIARFRKCINTMNYINIDDPEKEEETLLNIRFEDYADIDLYQTEHKEAFFFIGLTDDRKEEMERNNKENINNNNDLSKLKEDCNVGNKSKNKKIIDDESEDEEYDINNNEIFVNDLKEKEKNQFMKKVYEKNSLNMMQKNQEEDKKINEESIKGRESISKKFKRKNNISKKSNNEELNNMDNKDDIVEVINLNEEEKEELDIKEKEEEKKLVNNTNSYKKNKIIDDDEESEEEKNLTKSSTTNTNLNNKGNNIHSQNKSVTKIAKKSSENKNQIQLQNISGDEYDTKKTFISSNNENISNGAKNNSNNTSSSCIVLSQEKITENSNGKSTPIKSVRKKRKETQENINNENNNEKSQSNSTIKSDNKSVEIAYEDIVRNNQSILSKIPRNDSNKNDTNKTSPSTTNIAGPKVRNRIQELLIVNENYKGERRKKKEKRNIKEINDLTSLGNKFNSFANIFERKSKSINTIANNNRNKVRINLSARPRSRSNNQIKIKFNK